MALAALHDNEQVDHLLGTSYCQQRLLTASSSKEEKDSSRSGIHTLTDPKVPSWHSRSSKVQPSLLTLGCFVVYE